MYIGLTKTAYGTQRLYIRARDEELARKFDDFQTVKQYLNLVCCWGGVDKSERDRDDEGGFLSWELREEGAEAVYITVRLALTRMNVSFEDDIMKATDRD
jgi:hypothetical protein